MAPGQAPGIAVHARNCVEGFKTLSNSCQDSTQEPQCQISHSMVCDELGRYKIWAGNLGALQEAYSPTSLDYRLKAQPKIENQIIELLEDLEETLEEGRLDNLIEAIPSDDIPSLFNSFR